MYLESTYQLYVSASLDSEKLNSTLFIYFIGLLMTLCTFLIKYFKQVHLVGINTNEIIHADFLIKAMPL